jgi:hypothetical protein
VGGGAPRGRCRNRDRRDQELDPDSDSDPDAEGKVIWAFARLVGTRPTGVGTWKISVSWGDEEWVSFRACAFPWSNG